MPCLPIPSSPTVPLPVPFSHRLHTPYPALPTHALPTPPLLTPPLPILSYPIPTGKKLVLSARLRLVAELDVMTAATAPTNGYDELTERGFKDSTIGFTRGFTGWVESSWLGGALLNLLGRALRSKGTGDEGSDREQWLGRVVDMHKRVHDVVAKSESSIKQRLDANDAAVLSLQQELGKVRELLEGMSASQAAKLRSDSTSSQLQFP